MAGDGRSLELALLVNVADAQRQCADCMATFRDVLTEQVHTEGQLSVIATHISVASGEVPGAPHGASVHVTC